MVDDPPRREGDSDVLGSLPRERPARRSAKRDRAHAPTTAAAATDQRIGPRRSVPPAGYATPSPERRSAPGTGELVTTAVRAAGEVAQLGAGIGRRLLHAAVGRLGGGR